MFYASVVKIFCNIRKFFSQGLDLIDQFIWQQLFDLNNSFAARTVALDNNL